MAWKPLNDLQWEFIEPLISEQRMRRPRSRDREILDAIIYVLTTGIQWDNLPKTFPPKSTVYDRFQNWRKAGFFIAKHPPGGGGSSGS
jgi:putative transposase